MRVITKSLRFIPTHSGQYWCPEGLLDADQVELLGRCQSLRDINEHARNIGTALGLEHEQAPIAESLQELLWGGFLADERELVPASVGDTRRTASTISTCAIITSNHQDALRRGHSDYGKLARDEGRRLLIADDSQTQTEQLQSSGADVVDRARRAAWLDSIADAALRQIARWSLLPDVESDVVTVGANTNAVMLTCVGEKIACLDDGISSPITRVHTSEPSRLKIASPLDPTELLIHDSSESAIGDGVISDKSPFKLLEFGLGEVMKQMIGDHAIELPSTLTPDTTNALMAGGRILTTTLGIAGDSGMSSSHWYLGLRGESGALLDDNFDKRLFSRSIQRAAPCTQFSQSSFFMSTCAGMDLSACLPPFFPTQRNSDGLFALCLRHVAPQAFRAYHPFMVSDRPDTERPFSPESLFKGIASPTLGTILGEAIDNAPTLVFADDLELSCQQLGQQLQILATRSSAHFMRWLRERAFSRHSERLRWYQHLITVVDPIRHAVIQQGQELTRAAMAALDDEQRLTPPGVPQSDVQLLLHRFGQLIEAWPALRQHAKDVPMLCPHA